MKWIASLSTYLAIGIGLFVFHSAWGALLGFHAVVLISLLIARPNIPVKILFTSKHIKWIVLSVLLCGSSGVTVYYFWGYFDFAPDIAQQIAALGLNIKNWPFFIAYFTMVNPFLEEFFWRGYLGSESKSPHTSDFLYAGFHGLILIHKTGIFSVVFALALLVIAGWFWRQLYREDTGLLAPVLGHMAADLTILFAVYRMTI